VRTDPAARPDPDPAPDAPPELASALDRLRRLKERGPDIAVVPRVAGPPSPHRATG
jgi:hypothetical protein